MKSDLPNNIVEDVAIAVVLMSETPEVKNWTVYIINLKNEAITNVLRACLGLPPNNHMALEHRFGSSIREQQERSNNIDGDDYNLPSPKIVENAKKSR